MPDDYDIEALISAIKSQEVIWNTKLKDYNNIEKKRKAWKFVCTNVIDNFNEKHPHLKNVIAQVLQKEWKILKYGYLRYININVNATAEKYFGYRHQLSFLSTIVQTSPGRTHTSKRSSSADFTNKYQKSKRKSSMTNDETENLSKHSQPELSNCDVEQDRMFLLSLVGDFNKIDEQYKLDARSEIINVIKFYKEMPHPSCEREFKNNNNNSP